jgi:hypothetical protein
MQSVGEQQEKLNLIVSGANRKILCHQALDSKNKFCPCKVQG